MDESTYMNMGPTRVDIFLLSTCSFKNHLLNLSLDRASPTFYRWTGAIKLTCADQPKAYAHGRERLRF